MTLADEKQYDILHLILLRESHQLYRTEVYIVYWVIYAMLRGHSRQTLIKFTHVLYINLQVMTPIQINGSDCTVCKWILWLDATQLQLLKERNDSIPVIHLLSFHFQFCQTCSFVLGFIPITREPVCPLPQLPQYMHTAAKAMAWLDGLALNDFLCGLG